MAQYPAPNPPMLKAELYCPEGSVKVRWTELYNNVLAFKCEKFIENPAGSWYMVLKDTRLRAAQLKQRIVSKHVMQVWIGRTDGGVPMDNSHRVWMGIVDGVAENETVSKNSYYTELVITGRCMGGVLVDMPVFYQGWGEGLDKWWGYSIDMRADAPDEWMREIVRDFIWRHRECDMAWAPNGKDWIRDTNIRAIASEGVPQGIRSMRVHPQHGSSVWGTMEQAMLRPWTETFIEVAGEHAGSIYHRVKPWNSLSPVIGDMQDDVANPPGVPAPSRQGRWIRRENFISQRTHISDEDYYNHVMVNPVNNIMTFGEIDIDLCGGAQTAAGVGVGGVDTGAAPIDTSDPTLPGAGCVVTPCPRPPKNPQVMSTFGCADNRACQSRYGVKSMRLNFNLGDPAAKNQDYAIPYREVQGIAVELLKWYQRPYERAEITVRGAMYHCGHYIPDYHNGGNVPKWWYIEGVSQEWVYGSHWYSTLHLSEARPQPHNVGWGREFCVSGGGMVGGERGTFERVSRL